VKARLTNGRKRVGQPLLRLVAVAARVLAHVARDVAERQEADEHAVRVGHGQAPHLVFAHDLFGQAQLVVRRAGAHAARHGALDAGLGQVLPLHERGHRDVAIRQHGYYFAIGRAHRQSTEVFLPHQLRGARQRVFGRANVHARAHCVVHRRAERTAVRQVPQHEVSRAELERRKELLENVANGEMVEIYINTTLKGPKTQKALILNLGPK